MTSCRRQIVQRVLCRKSYSHCSANSLEIMANRLARELCTLSKLIMRLLVKHAMSVFNCTIANSVFLRTCTKLPRMNKYWYLYGSCCFFFVHFLFSPTFRTIFRFALVHASFHKNIQFLQSTYRDFQPELQYTAHDPPRMLFRTAAEIDVERNFSDSYPCSVEEFEYICVSHVTNFQVRPNWLFLFHRHS